MTGIAMTVTALAIITITDPITTPTIPGIIIITPTIAAATEITIIAILK